MKNIKNVIFTYLYISILLVILYSCRKLNTVAEIKIPEQENVLVLNSLFTNDSVLTVNVSQSADFFKKESPSFINNAVCKLYVNGNFEQDLFNTGNGNYRSGVIPSYGNSYELKISTQGFKEIIAKSSLPPEPVLVESKTYIDPAKNIFSFGIKEVANTKNYYSISLLVIETDSFGNYLQTYPLYLSAANNSNLGNIFGISDESAPEYYFESDISNGNDISDWFTISNYNEGYSTDSDFIAPVKTYITVIKNISKEMFLYKQSFHEQLKNSSNPFAEPVLVYNNIMGGFGIFAGYSFKAFEVPSK